MKAIGNTAANIASNTKYKVDEVTLQNRRREVLNDLAYKTYALWLKGESFPEEMTKMLEELKQLDEQLNDMKAAKYASARQLEQAETTDTEPEYSSDSEEQPEEEEPDNIPSENSPVRTEINGLFDGTSDVGKAAEKVNSSLDQMSDRIRSFPPENHPEETEIRQD